MADRAGGYALVEMLATLIVIGMMSAMMVAGLGSSQRVWQRVDAANAMGDSIAGVQILLRDRLERIFPATRYDKIPAYADIDGAADKITFLAPPRDVHAPAALVRYQLALATNGDLVLSAMSDVAPAKDPPIENLVLLHNVQALDIAYFGIVPPDSKPGWKFAWERRPAPPQLIRIRVQFPPQDPRFWPELIVKPFATVDTMCVLMVMTGKCRGRA